MVVKERTTEGQQPLLSACMIVKNEARALPRCLASLRDFVDEICIIDTGSTDASLDIMKRFGAKVYSVPWNDNFAAARNAALERAAGRWILIIDADETLCREDGPTLRKLLESSDKEAYFVQLLSYIGEERPDRLIRNQVVRLIRNNPSYRYQGKIHEGLDLTEAGDAIDICDIRIYHYGYLDNVKRDKKKGERNLALLKKEVAANPENPFHHFNIGTEYFNLGDYNLALEHYEQAAKFASPKDLYAALLAKRYISCLQVLGRHFKAIQIAKKAQKDFPHFTDVVFQKANSFLAMGQLSKALQTFRTCVEMGEPNDPLHPAEEVGVGSFKALWCIGQIHERMQNESDAIQAYRDALACEPHFRPALERLIGLLRKRCSEEETVEALYLSGKADDLAVLMAAEIFRERGDYRACLTLFTNYPLSKNQDLQCYWKGLSLVRLGEVNEGLAVLERIPNQSPVIQKSLLEQVFAAWFANDLTRAQNLLESYKKQFGATAAYQVYHAVHLLLTRKDTANLSLPTTDESRCIVLDVLHALYALKLTGVLQGMEALALHHFGGNVVGAIARMHRKAGVPPGAAPGVEKLLQTIVETDSLSFEDWMDLGRLALDQGRPGEALSCFQTASQVDTCWASSYLEPAFSLIQKAESVLQNTRQKFPGAEPLEKVAAVLEGKRRPPSQ